MTNATASDILTAEISGTYGWYAGRGVLATLVAGPNTNDVGYTRQEVAGTKADFESAIAAAEAEHKAAKGAHKGSLTALIKNLRGAIRFA